MTIIRPGTIANQVNALLRERIRDGVYPPGGRLPSESELCDDFGVSRATVRTVLAKLATEGLILRKQGDGTYINEHIQQINTHLGGLWEFGRLIESSGYRPSIRSISISERSPTVGESQNLNLREAENVLALERLFYADGKPVILAHNSIPSRLVDQGSGPFDGGLNIRDFLWRYCHRKIAYAISDIHSVMAGEELVDLLSLQRTRPLLQIQIIFYDRDNQPLVCGTSYFDDKLLRLRLVQAWGG
ncbi:GntR family transcriptional regulator [Chloroflexota bacterium]